MPEVCSTYTTTIFENPIYWATLLILFVFGFLYNRQVVKWEESGYGDYCVSLFVALGVAITIFVGMIYFYGLIHIVFIITLFMASGIPMIYGSLKRYGQRQREANEEAIRALKRVMGGEQQEQ